MVEALSSRSIFPEAVVDSIYEKLNYAALRGGGFSRRLLVMGLNLLPFLAALPLVALLAGQVMAAALALVPLLALVAALSSPPLLTAGSGLKELFNSVYSFDIFASVLLATGDLCLAARKASEAKGKAPEMFRESLLLMRNGLDPERALLRAFKGDELCLEWISAAIRGRDGSLTIVLAEWYSNIRSKISKAEDLLSLVIALSAILPVLLSIMMASWGLTATLFSPAIVIALSLCLEAILMWFRGLEEILS